MLVTSATVSSRAYWSGDREAVEAPFPPSIGRGPACSSAGSTAERAGCRRVLPHGLGHTAAAPSTVNAIFLKSCSQVFDEMPERNSNSNFLKLPPWVVKIFSKVSKYIFVAKKDDVLQKFYFKIWVWSLFQIQTLADV
jgi:hypothetical protein